MVIKHQGVSTFHRVTWMNTTGLILWCEEPWTAVRSSGPASLLTACVSSPGAAVSPISQGPGFIKAWPLLPSTLCHIPDNKPEIVCAAWHAETWRENIVHTQDDTATRAQTHVHTVNTGRVFVCTNTFPHTQVCCRWPVSAAVSFV